MPIIVQTFSEFARDFDWLKGAIADWLHREDLAERIPDFIMLAEQRLNRLPRVRGMQVQEVLALAPGSRLVALPLDYNTPVTAWMDRDQGRVQLTPAVPEQLAVTSNPGQPQYWCIDGANLMVERPADVEYSITLRYYGLYRLSDAATINALLIKYPDLYLYASLIESAPYVRDPGLLGIWQDRYDRAVKEITVNESRARGAVPLTTDLGQLLGHRSTI